MEWWIVFLSLALGIATYGLYCLVDKLRDAP